MPRSAPRGHPGHPGLKPASRPDVTTTMDPSPASPPPPQQQQPVSPPPRKSSGWWWKIPAALALVLVILIVVVALSLDTLLRIIVRSRIEQVTGLPTKLAAFDLRFRPPGVSIQGFELRNSPEFGGEMMLSLPEVTVLVDREALRDQKLRLELARIHIGEVHMVVNQNGQTNFAALKTAVEAEQARTGKSSGADALKDKPEFAGVDRFELSIGTLRYTDLRDPSLNRRVTTGLTNLVVENATSGPDLGFKLLGAAIMSGVDVLNLFQGGMENLPRQDEFR